MLGSKYEVPKVNLIFPLQVFLEFKRFQNLLLSNRPTVRLEKGQRLS